MERLGVKQVKWECEKMKWRGKKIEVEEKSEKINERLREKMLRESDEKRGEQAKKEPRC